MIEQVTLTGDKHCFASDIQQAQTETLEPLQRYFEDFGTCVIEGAAITANGGNWDISSAIVGINHADGFKVARYAGSTNVALPGYLSISKTVQNGVYEDNPSKAISNTYTATFTAGAPPNGTDLYLVIPVPTALIEPVRFANAFAAKSIISHQYSPVSTMFQNAAITAGYNKATCQVYLKGYIELINFNAYTSFNQIIQVLSASDLNSQGIPTPGVGSGVFWPVSFQHVFPNTIVDANNKDYIRDVLGYITEQGLWVQGIKPITGVSVYELYVNAVIVNI